MQKRDNYDVLYVVEKNGKPIKVGLRGQNAYARKKDAEAIITRLVAGRWPYGLKDASRDEFTIRRFVPAGGELQKSSVLIKSNGPTGQNAYVKVNGNLITNLRRAELSIGVNEVNTLELEKFEMEQTLVDIEGDVEYYFGLPSTKEERKALYNQLLEEYGEELRDA